MSRNVKRRDNKGRVLQTGETQRSDGRYVYSYTEDGKRQYLYSWRLTKADPVPAGKGQCKDLRSMEEEVSLARFSGESRISPATLNQMFDISIDLYGQAKPTTRDGYKYAYNHYVKASAIGEKPIQRITADDIRKFNNGLFAEQLSTTTVKRINAIISRVFSYAVCKKIIKTNPMLEISLNDNENDIHEVEPLTIWEVRKLLEFVKNSQTYHPWYPLILFQIHTGLRIGETAALTWDMIDWDTGMIHVRYMIRRSFTEEGKECFSVGTTKSKKGKRDVPMTENVKELLSEIRDRQIADGTYRKFEFQGLCGFVFQNRNGEMIRQTNVNHYMAKIRKAYNKMEAEKAKMEMREPHYMPPIHSHVYRHTFCTSLCSIEGVSLPAVQDVMGHSSIDITTRVYNKVSNRLKNETIQKFSRQFSIQA